MKTKTTKPSNNQTEKDMRGTKEKLSMREFFKRVMVMTLKNLRLRHLFVPEVKQLRETLKRRRAELGYPGFYIYVAGFDRNGKVHLVAAASPTKKMALAGLWVFFPVASFDTQEELSKFIQKTLEEIRQNPEDYPEAPFMLPF